MKIKCPLSGIEFSLPHFSGLNSDSIHPIFSQEVNKFLGPTLSKFAREALSPEELHLFGTFLVSKLPIESWDFPLLSSAFPLSYWTPFWLKNVQALSSLVLRLNGKTPKNLPTFRVSYPDLAEPFAPLSNLDEWIKEANHVCTDFYASISTEAHKRNKAFRANLADTDFASEDKCNAVIEKALRGSILSPREKDKFPELISNWAAKVGDFPNSIFKTTQGERKTIRNFWKEIIRNAFDLGANGRGYNNILTSDITVADLEELIEHCAENIPHSTLHSFALYEQLGKLKEVIQEFRPSVSSANLSIAVLSPGDIDSILSDVSHIAPVKKIQETDPLMPKREDFPSVGSFLKAKIAYKALSEKAV